MNMDNSISFGMSGVRFLLWIEILIQKAQEVLLSNRMQPIPGTKRKGNSSKTNIH